MHALSNLWRIFNFKDLSFMTAVIDIRPLDTWIEYTKVHFNYHYYTEWSTQSDAIANFIILLIIS